MLTKREGKMNRSTIILCKSLIKHKPIIHYTIYQRFSSKIDNKTLIYHGNYEPKLKLLRRISLLSSVVSVIGLPLLITSDFGHNSVPEIGKIAVSICVMFASVSSTSFLSLISKPYITKMYVINDTTSENNISIANAINTSNPKTSNIKDIQFIAERLNIFGNIITTTFTYNDIEFIKAAVHPFATFRVKGSGFYYVYGSNFKDDKIKALLRQ